MQNDVLPATYGYWKYVLSPQVIHLVMRYKIVIHLSDPEGKNLNVTEVTTESGINLTIETPEVALSNKKNLPYLLDLAEQAFIEEVLEIEEILNNIGYV